MILFYNKLKNIRNIANQIQIRRMNTTKKIAEELVTKKTNPSFKTGDNITVHYTIKEGENRERNYLKET